MEDKIEDIGDIETHQIPYDFGSKIPVDEGWKEYNFIHFDLDQEHEFKAVQLTSSPIDSIADYANVSFIFYLFNFSKKYVNAFLNTNGGTIYFGVEDDGRIEGVPLNRKSRDIIRLRVDSIIGCKNFNF